MGDLLAALVEALFNLVIALVSLVTNLFAMLLESLGFAVGRLSEKPSEGESRFSVQRLAAAFAPMMLVVMVVVSVVGYFILSSKIEANRRDATRALIRSHLESLSTAKDGQGRFKPNQLAMPIDAWGNQIAATYTTSVTHEHIEVRSPGPDGKFGTADDMNVKKSQMLPKKMIATGLLRLAKDAIVKQSEEK
jgi:hypothetical protein